jgi:hypothetical protein
VIQLLSTTWVKTNDALRRAGWRLGMFGGVIVGGVLAAFISPTPTGATVNDALDAAPLVRIVSPSSQVALGRGAAEATIAVSSLAR